MRSGHSWLFWVALGVVGCQATPNITVVRTTAGDKTQEVRGDNVKLKRGPLEAYGGARGGLYVVRSTEDWQHAWPSDKSPPVPPTLDTNTQMLLLAVGESAAVARVKVQRAVETAELITVWVRETRIGESCPKVTERAFDAVVAARADKPIRFVVEQETGDSCGDAPTAAVQCRLRSQPTWSSSLAAQPGDSVECEMSSAVRGKFELVDRQLSVELPPGSATKMVYEKDPLRGDFGIDVYGTYRVNAEAADESGRRGRAAATVDVKPPKTRDVLVQLVWAGFDLKDESDTFPRVNLRVAEEGPRGQRCSAEIPVPGLCEVKTRGAYTYMRIPEGNRRLPVSIQFLDERAEKGPGPCVHVWYDGQRTAETCDRKHRDTDEIWRVGTLDTTTGLLLPDGAAPPLAAAPDASAPPPPPAKKPAPKRK